MNIANKLTILRIVMIPFFMYALLDGQLTLALILFAIASFTDFLDGY